MWALNCRAGANLRHLGSVCWQPTALEPTMWALNCRAGANLRHLGSVCWQPTALQDTKAGLKLQGWGQLEASWVCMLATYSTWSQQCGL